MNARVIRIERDRRGKLLFDTAYLQWLQRWLSPQEALELLCGLSDHRAFAMMYIIADTLNKEAVLWSMKDTTHGNH